MSASFLERLPRELRHSILSLVIWDPTPLVDYFSKTRLDRVRLKDGCDIWIEPTLPPPPTALPLLLTSRTVHYDVRHLVSSPASPPYQLDVAFVPGCGLFPTWTMCPLPSQTHGPSLRVAIRILSHREIDQAVCQGPHKVTFQARFRGYKKSSFKVCGSDPPTAPGRIQLLPPPVSVPCPWATWRGQQQRQQRRASAIPTIHCDQSSRRRDLQAQNRPR